MGMGKWVAKLGQDTDMETFLLILLCRVFVTTSQKDYCVYIGVRATACGHTKFTGVTFLPGIYAAWLIHTIDIRV